MMMNLFSVFDPVTGMLSMNWLSMTLLIFYPTMFWNMLSKLNLIIMKMMMSLFMEITANFKKTKFSIFFISMFMFILANNIMGLLPYVFTASSHMLFSLSLALSMWIALMMFGWLNFTNKMFTHLVPTGTPIVLMPFMVMIETVSNIIRPGSLAVRLTANMIAGHMLMSLLGNNMLSTMLLLLMWLSMLLMLFESAVAIIQSYVFMTLSTLYSSEI
uniref:ATP synthase F0 subunit 6 n=1 Tax=Eupelix cuspidata TaxID=139504 RepID=UPI002E75A9B8|nr:ATP synthase F0 subunit 6 [Eupelix cuspidata]WRK21444.1 ATP synthase F0 subunit 6 [Eupelix cuspidata]